MSDPEPCTTQARRKQHWSVDLAEVDRSRDAGGKGRTGHTLCGQFAHDEENTNARLAQWHAKPIVIADLPPCKKCAASRGVPIASPEPWRFDVPEVPEQVTALHGSNSIEGERLWLRVDAPAGFAEGWGGSWWACRWADGSLGPTAHITDIAPFAPLVEAVDPRVAS